MSLIYVHKKRRTEYKIIAECQYADSATAFEGDNLEMVTTKAVFATEKSNDYQKHHLYGIPEAEPGGKGSLQCSTPVQKGHWLVCYVDLEGKHIWYRPRDEFYDKNRFFIKGTKER